MTPAEATYVIAWQNVIAAVSDVEAYVTPALSAQVEALEAQFGEDLREELREIARSVPPVILRVVRALREPGHRRGAAPDPRRGPDLRPLRREGRGAPMTVQLVELHSRYGPEDGPLFTVATDSASEIARLKQRGEQKGFEVRVRRADTFDGTWRFLDQYGGKS